VSKKNKKNFKWPSLVSNESPGWVDHEYIKLLALRCFGGAHGTPIPPKVPNFQSFWITGKVGFKRKLWVCSWRIWPNFCSKPFLGGTQHPHTPKSAQFPMLLDHWQSGIQTKALDPDEHIYRFYHILCIMFFCAGPHCSWNCHTLGIFLMGHRMPVKVGTQEKVTRRWWWPYFSTLYVRLSFVWRTSIIPSYAGW